MSIIEKTMEFNVKKLPKSLVEISVKVPAEKVEKYMGTVCKELANKVNMPGFRKGHVPRAMLEKEFGKEGLLELAADKIIQQSYAEIVMEEKIHVVGHPTNVEMKSTDPFEYVITAPVYPEVKMKKYDDIKIKPEKVEATEEEVQEVLKELQEQAAEYKAVERAAKEGDRVNVNFEGFTPDGVPLENTKSENHPAVLGQGNFIPGFEENMKGMKPGEEKDFMITFPEDYHAKHMAGKETKFHIKMNGVEERILPEINEEFLEKHQGSNISVDEFKENIKGDILVEKEKKENIRQEEELIKELVSRTEMEIPDAIVEEELDQMMNEQKNYFESQGMDYEMWLSQIIKKSKEDMRKDWREKAVERVQSKIVIHEVLKEEKVEVSDEEVDAKIEEIISGYPGPDSKQKAKEIYRKEGRYYEPLRDKMKVEKLIATLRERFVK